MEFTSQICTTKNQSERLLALGLKKETADITYFNDEICLAAYNEMECPYDNLVHPAWSLHRLWELAVLSRIDLDSKDEIRVIYDGVIDEIERLIKEGYFDKEYLEEL